MIILVELVFVAFPYFAATVLQFREMSPLFSLLKKLSDDVLKQMLAVVSDIVTSLIGERSLLLVWVTSCFDRNKDMSISATGNQCSSANNFD